MKIDPYYRQQRCSLMTLVSGNIRFMVIIAAVPSEGASNNSGVIENVDFQGFRTLRLRHLSEVNIIIWYYLDPCHLSTDPKVLDLE